MNNSELAKIFRGIADFLELKQDNPFKVRAYQKAAQNLENLSENAVAILARGEKIPGIGRDLSEKILEFSRTGRLKTYENLKKSFPPGFLELTKVSGLGPKGALLLYKKLKIKNIADLEKSAQTGKIKKLKGMGAKKEENLLKAIAEYKERQGRFLLSSAETQAEEIIRSLKKIDGSSRILAAGSLRRRQETIGDIDILAAVQHPEKIMEIFTKLPQVHQVLSRGKTKSSLVLDSGLQADLRIVEPKSFGAALHYFTGSKQHNIKIREIAAKKGLKINEYGVFKGQKMLAGKTEAEVYQAVDLPYIPPELREDRGEIETRKLPSLVKLADIQGDLHLHTFASDGQNSIAEMAAAALKLGYQYIAITEHSVSSRVAGGLSVKEMLKHWEEMETIKGIKVLKGIEVDIKPDGKLDYPDQILALADVVIASVHSNFKQEKNIMTRRIIKALENPYVNILAHPTGRLISQRAAYEVDLDKVIQAAARTNTFIEVNAHPERLDLDDVHCKRAQELGVALAIGSDAHSILGFEVMRYGVDTARRGWISRQNVINTLPLEKLLKKLYIKRP